MRPKAPGGARSPRIPATPPSQTRADAEPPLRPSRLPGQASSVHDSVSISGSAEHTLGNAADRHRVEIFDLPAVRPTTPQRPPTLSDYLLNPVSLQGMKPADKDGFRHHAGRLFIDVENAGTVCVEFFPDLAAYRAVVASRKLPPGPAFLKNRDGNWIATDPSTLELNRPASHSFMLNTTATHHATTTVDPRADLLANALPQMLPDKSPEEIEQFLRAFNLSPAQHARLHREWLDSPQPIEMPVWAQQHKALSEDVNATDRFDHLHAEIEPLVITVRNGDIDEHAFADFQISISKAFLEQFLDRLGYQRNKFDHLVRTDIPALFRADDRTPVELFNDGRMLPRYKHKRGSTSAKPISASISLDIVRPYGRGVPDPTYLRYGSQNNKYPGKRARSGNADESDSSTDTPDGSDNEWSDQSASLDTDRHYTSARLEQQFNFVYIIDTRGMEVMPREENMFFNRAARTSGAGFPYDFLEALISSSRRGIETGRIWLLDSSLTRAVKISDAVEGLERGDADAIMSRTHGGSYNRAEYDALIDAAARAGKPVLRLHTGKSWVANDIVWPQ